jgi:hypothetical protein
MGWQWLSLPGSPVGAAAQDEEVRTALELGQNLSQGAILRVAAPIPGGWQIISVWEAHETFDALRRCRLPDARPRVRDLPPAWLGDGYELPVIEALRRRLGAAVTVGQAGFNLRNEPRWRYGISLGKWSARDGISIIKPALIASTTIRR